MAGRFGGRDDDRGCAAGALSLDGVKPSQMK